VKAEGECPIEKLFPFVTNVLDELNRAKGVSGSREVPQATFGPCMGFEPLGGNATIKSLAVKKSFFPPPTFFSKKAVSFLRKNIFVHCAGGGDCRVHLYTDIQTKVTSHWSMMLLIPLPTMKLRNPFSLSSFFSSLL
jgi:hypothetical protein